MAYNKKTCLKYRIFNLFLSHYFYILKRNDDIRALKTTTKKPLPCNINSIFREIAVQSTLLYNMQILSGTERLYENNTIQYSKSMLQNHNPIEFIK